MNGYSLDDRLTHYGIWGDTKMTDDHCRILGAGPKNEVVKREMKNANSRNTESTLTSMEQKRKSQALVPYQESKKWGFRDVEGNVVIQPVYERVRAFQEGLAPVRLDGKWGFIDSKGNAVVATIYDYVGAFDKGIAQAKLNGKWGFVDNRGNEVAPLVFDRLERSHGHVVLRRVLQDDEDIMSALLKPRQRHQ